MKAIVVGGTGLVGGLLIEELVSNSKFSKIVSIGRRSLDLKSDKIKNIIINNLSEISRIDLDSGPSVFFCCLGSTIKQAGTKENFKKVDYEGVMLFAELAKKVEASKFVLVSAKGANPNSSIFYNKTKGEAEEAIKKIGLRSITVYRPGLLFGERSEFRFFELVSISIVKGLKTLLGDNFLRSAVTPVKDLAKAMVDNSLVQETGYKVVDSSEIGK